eukprot:Skav206228  [mRNA]  locus=scaffold3776:24466:27126:+ [translate_table: standard]
MVGIGIRSLKVLIQEQRAEEERRKAMALEAEQEIREAAKAKAESEQREAEEKAQEERGWMRKRTEEKSGWLDWIGLAAEQERRAAEEKEKREADSALLQAAAKQAQAEMLLGIAWEFVANGGEMFGNGRE